MLQEPDSYTTTATPHRLKPTETRLAARLKPQGFAAGSSQYQTQRRQQLIDDYAHTPLTDELFARYRMALGPWRYWLLRRVQACLVPEAVRTVLALEPEWLTKLFLRVYHYLPGGGNKLRWLHGILLPRSYTNQLRALGQAYSAGQVG